MWLTTILHYQTPRHRNTLVSNSSPHYPKHGSGRGDLQQEYIISTGDTSDVF